MSVQTVANQPTDPYTILGVDRSADDAEIKRAYFRLVREHPPERDPERFQAIRGAYERVRSAEARTQTNLFLLQPPPELPRRRKPSYDLSLHPEDVGTLAFELGVAELFLNADFREPKVPG